MKSTILATAIAFSASAGAAGSATDAVRNLVLALEAGDIAAIEAAFTEDAGYAYSIDGALNRGDRFDRWLESDITAPGSVFIIESVREEQGATVDVDVMWGRGGNSNSEARYIFTVDNGQIDSWRMTRR